MTLAARLLLIGGRKQRRSRNPARGTKAIARKAAKTPPAKTPRASRRSQAPPLAGNLRGAKAAPMPDFIDPCLATLKDKAPAGDKWIHEIKYDGYRVQAHRDADRVALYTRRGHDWTDRFGPIAGQVAKLAVNNVIVDGEVVAVDASGKPDFALLQEELAAGQGHRLLYYIFDLLYLDGFDLRAVPLIERKHVLHQLLQDPSQGPVVFSEHMEAGGESMFANACAMGLEGIVSKKRHARYTSDRSENWVKVKCQKRGHYPIIAFVEKLGAKPRRIASL